MDPDSMLYWWPKVITPPRIVPMPQTVLIEHHAEMGEHGEVIDIEKVEGKIRDGIREVGLPAFIRTDQMSGKHSWKKTCFYDGSGELWKHIATLCDASWGADLLGFRVSGFAVRQYIELETRFTAFWGDMPVARERRYFVQDGHVICHHPYWIEDAIRRPSIPDWEYELKDLNRETKPEVDTLTSYAEDLSRKLPGYWSLDFARARTGGWYFIDAAVGENSWHPECQLARRREKGYEGREPI